MKNIEIWVTIGTSIVMVTAAITRIWARSRGNSHRLDKMENDITRIRNCTESTSKDLAEVIGYLKGIDKTLRKNNGH